jgi:hypothetical protein
LKLATIGMPCAPPVNDEPVAVTLTKFGGAPRDG